MTLFERIKSLASKRDKSMKEVAIDLGFSENLFYRWKTTEPKGVDLEKVADYFEVSVDYLLGRSENPNLNTEPPNNEFNEFFKMRTDGLPEDQIETLKEEWLDYLEIRTRRMEERNRKKNN